MVDAVGSVTKIVEVALEIKAAVDTVRQNNEDCLQIKKRVSRLSAILSKLEDTATMKDPAMSATLLELEGTLRRAYSLVQVCQEKHFVSHLFTANNMSKQLVKVDKEITTQMIDVILATNIQMTIMFTTRFQNGLHPAPSNNAEEGESSHCSQPTDDTSRSEVNGVHQNAPAVSDVAGLSSCFTKFSLSELEAATNNFSEENLIGQGGFATVYKGVLTDGLVVAIKRFHDQWGQGSVRQYVHVYSVLLQHENVVRLLGYCQEDGLGMVVEDYMPNGTLSEIIDGSFQQLDWCSKFRIIRGIAKGVAYLHTKCTIHLDLKPTNILFDSDMNPKICDFELSRVFDQGVMEAVTEELICTLDYAAPEYLADGFISVKNDVFSFGVLLLHTISGMSRGQNYVKWAWEVLADQSEFCYDPSFCDESRLEETKRYVEIGLLCTQESTEDRPTMEHVVQMLNFDEKCVRL